MKIKHLKINGFGKLKQKELNLNNGINIIYGKNEAGKSSLLKFISCMFYGASKNKNGRDISDFEKFKPWKTEEFSGKIEYELDSGESFEVYREFKKKNPTVYNSEKEDISKTFKEDKTKGIDFFTEQTGIDEETYFNTAITEQDAVALNKANQISIIQKISNLVSSGDDNVSYKKSLAQINKLQTEKVGTDRTVLKPINIVNARIKELSIKKEKLEDFKQQNDSDILGAENLSYKLKDEEKKVEFLKKVKELSENNRLKYAEINFMKNAEKENAEKIAQLEEHLEEVESNEEGKNKKFNIRPYIISMIICCVIVMCLIIILPNKIIGISTLIALVLTNLIILSKKKSSENKSKSEIHSVQDKILNEIEVLKKNQEEKELEIIEKSEKLNKEIEKEKNALTEEYLKRLDINFLESAFSKSYEDILEDIKLREKSVSRISLDIHETELNKKAYNEKLEELSKIQEDLEAAEEEREELISLNNSYNLAKECLEKAYEEVKKNISPKFTNNLCEIIKEISNGKYNVVKFTDDEGLIVELDSGNYVPAERLSIGTIDQMYLSLRLSALKEMSEEQMPIILDEAFAYFDNERLKNILSYLNENYKDNQILILTCINREEEILKELNIPYSVIEL